MRPIGKVYRDGRRVWVLIRRVEWKHVQIPSVILTKWTESSLGKREDTACWKTSIEGL